MASVRRMSENTKVGALCSEIKSTVRRKNKKKWRQEARKLIKS